MKRQNAGRFSAVIHLMFRWSFRIAKIGREKDTFQPSEKIMQMK
jgi:hypothetical protein